MTKKPAPILVRTPRATLAFAHIMKPDTEGKYADGKFKGTFIFDLDADLSRGRGRGAPPGRDRLPEDEAREGEHPDRRR